VNDAGGNDGNLKSVAELDRMIARSLRDEPDDDIDDTSDTEDPELLVCPSLVLCHLYTRGGASVKNLHPRIICYRR